MTGERVVGAAMKVLGPEEAQKRFPTEWRSKLLQGLVVARPEKAEKFQFSGIVSINQCLFRRDCYENKV